MDDLISRQAAIDAVFNLDASHRVSWKDAVIDTLDALPPAQRNGKWITFDYEPHEYYMCNKCSYIVRKSFNYCPNCGARMEMGEDE